MRAICRVSDGRADLYSRNRNIVTASYPELAAAVEELAGRTDLILDGEIIAPDPVTGIPSFTRLQRRCIHFARRANSWPRCRCSCFASICSNSKARTR
ncbi:hypothetical protein ACIHDR_11535 [Nocardia sp. NPDC052278]